MSDDERLARLGLSHLRDKPEELHRVLAHMVAEADAEEEASAKALEAACDAKRRAAPKTPKRQRASKKAL